MITDNPEQGRLFEADSSRQLSLIEGLGETALEGETPELTVCVPSEPVYIPDIVA